MTQIESKTRQGISRVPPLLRSRGSLLACAFAAVALAAGAVTAFAVGRDSPHPATPQLMASRTPAAQPLGPSGLDPLRNEALMGDEMSRRRLIGILFDRFDANGDAGDLYEAMVWLDRQWDRTGQAEQGPRVVAHYCGQRVVRWHRLCDAGE